MPKTFAEIIAEIRETAGEVIPEETITELQTTYNDDLSIRDAAVQERESRIAEKDKEIGTERAEAMRLKAVNYDLLMAAPKTGNTVDNENPGGEDNTPRGVDSLFE